MASIGFISQHQVVSESSGQVNIEIGVISGSLAKEVIVTVSTLGLDALGNNSSNIMLKIVTIILYWQLMKTLVRLKPVS